MSEDVPVSDEKSSSSNPEPESSKNTPKCVISLQTMVPIARPKIRRNKKRTIEPQAPITTHEVTSFAISHAYSQNTGDIAIKPQDHVWKREPNRIEHDNSVALYRTSEKTTFSPTYTSSLQLSKSSSTPVPATEASTVKINNAYRFPMGVPETVSSTAHRREPPSSHLPWLPPPPSLIPLPLPPQLTSYLVDGPVRTRRGGGFGSVREHQLYAGASSGALAAAIVAKSTKYDKSGNIIQNPDESLPSRMDASEGKSIGTRYAIQSQNDSLSSTNTANTPISPSNPTSSRTEASKAAVTSVTPAHAPKPNLGAVELMPSSAPYHPLQQVRVAAGALVTKARRLKVDMAAQRVAQDEQELRQLAIAHSSSSKPHSRNGETSLTSLNKTSTTTAPSNTLNPSHQPSSQPDFTRVGRVPVAGVASHYALCALDALACVERGVDARVRSRPGPGPENTPRNSRPGVWTSGSATQHDSSFHDSYSGTSARVSPARQSTDRVRNHDSLDLPHHLPPNNLTITHTDPSSPRDQSSSPRRHRRTVSMEYPGNPQKSGNPSPIRGGSVPRHGSRAPPSISHTTHQDPSNLSPRGQPSSPSPHRHPQSPRAHGHPHSPRTHGQTSRARDGSSRDHLQVEDSATHLQRMGSSTSLQRWGSSTSLQRMGSTASLDRVVSMQELMEATRAPGRESSANLQGDGANEPRAGAGDRRAQEQRQIDHNGRQMDQRGPNVDGIMAMADDIATDMLMGSHENMSDITEETEPSPEKSTNPSQTQNSQRPLPPARDRIRLLAWLSARPIKPPYLRAYPTDASGHSILLPPAWAGVNKSLIDVDARGLAFLYPMLALEKRGGRRNKSGQMDRASAESSRTELLETRGGDGYNEGYGNGFAEGRTRESAPVVLLDSDLCNLLQLVPDCLVLLRALQILQGLGLHARSASELVEMVSALLNEVAEYVKPVHTLIHQHSLLPPPVLADLHPKTCFQLLLHSPAPPATVPMILRTIMGTRGRFTVLPQLAHAITGCFQLLSSGNGQSSGAASLSSPGSLSGTGFDHISATKWKFLHRWPNSAAYDGGNGNTQVNMYETNTQYAEMERYGFIPDSLFLPHQSADMHDDNVYNAPTQPLLHSQSPIDTSGSSEQHVVFGWLREWRKPLLALIRHERTRRLHVHQATSNFDAKAVSSDAFKGLALSLEELNALVGAAQAGDPSGSIYVRSYPPTAKPSDCRCDDASKIDNAHGSTGPASTMKSTDSTPMQASRAAVTPSNGFSTATITTPSNGSNNAANPTSQLWRYHAHPCDFSFFDFLTAPAPVTKPTRTEIESRTSSDFSPVIRSSGNQPSQSPETNAPRPSPHNNNTNNHTNNSVTNNATNTATATKPKNAPMDSPTAASTALYLTDHAIHGLLPLQRTVITTGVKPAESHVSAGCAQLKYVLSAMIESGTLSDTAMEELTPLLPHGKELSLAGPAILIDLVTATAICLQRSCQALLAYFNSQHTRAELLANEGHRGDDDAPGDGQATSSPYSPTSLLLSRATRRLSEPIARLSLVTPQDSPRASHALPSPVATAGGKEPMLPPLTSAHIHHAMHHIGAGIYGAVVIADYLDLCARVTALREAGVWDGENSGSTGPATGKELNRAPTWLDRGSREAVRDAAAVFASANPTLSFTTLPSPQPVVQQREQVFRSPFLPSVATDAFVTLDKDGPRSLILGKKEREMLRARIFPGVSYQIPEDAGFAYIVVNAAMHYKALRAAYISQGSGVYTGLGCGNGTLLTIDDSALLSESGKTEDEEQDRVSRHSFFSPSQSTTRLSTHMPPLPHLQSVVVDPTQPPVVRTHSHAAKTPSNAGKAFSTVNLLPRTSVNGMPSTLRAQSINAASTSASPRSHSRMGSGDETPYGQNQHIAKKPRFDTTPRAVLSSALPLVHAELFQVLSKNTLIAALAKRSSNASSSSSGDLVALSAKSQQKSTSSLTNAANRPEHTHTGSNQFGSSARLITEPVSENPRESRASLIPNSPASTTRTLEASPSSSFNLTGGKSKSRKITAAAPPLVEFSLSLLQLDRLVWAGLLSVHHTVIALGYAEQLGLEIHNMDELLEILKQTQWAIDLVALHKDTKLQERLQHVERVRRLQQLYGTKSVAHEEEDEDEDDEEEAENSQRTLSSPFGSPVHPPAPVIPVVVEIPKPTALLTLSGPPSPLTPVQALRSIDDELTLLPSLDTLMRNHDAADNPFQSKTQHKGSPPPAAPSAPSRPAPAPTKPAPAPMKRAPAPPAAPAPRPATEAATATSAASAPTGAAPARSDTPAAAATHSTTSTAAALTSPANPSTTSPSRDKGSAPLGTSDKPSQGSTTSTTSSSTALKSSPRAPGSMSNAELLAVEASLPRPESLQSSASALRSSPTPPPPSPSPPPVLAAPAPAASPSASATTSSLSSANGASTTGASTTGVSVTSSAGAGATGVTPMTPQPPPGPPPPRGTAPKPPARRAPAPAPNAAVAGSTVDGSTAPAETSTPPTATPSAVAVTQ